MSELAITCQKVVKNLDDSVLAAGVNMPNIGLLRAALSPQNARIRAALYPEREDGTVSYDEDGYPVANLDFRVAGDLTQDDVVTSATCGGTETMSKRERVKYIINQYAELGYKITNATANAICAEYDAVEAQFAGKHGVRSNVGGNRKNTINGQLADRVRKIINHIDTYAGTKLAAGVGANKLYPDPDNAGEFLSDAQLIKLFDVSNPNNPPLSDFAEEVDKLQLVHQLTGRPIIITDSLDMRRYFKKLGIACCSDVGLNYGDLLNSPYEYYYSDKLTAALGETEANNIIVLWPETFVFLNIDKWRNMQLVAGKNQIKATTFGSFRIVEPQFRFDDPAYIQDYGDPAMIFDLRLIEQDCDNSGNAAFALTFVPSMQYNFVTAPANADGVTGIFQYKIDNGVAP